jgi:hypothetical protein
MSRLLASCAMVAAGTALKASSVGANTVNGPVARSVSAKPASLISFARVDSWGVPAAVSTIDFGVGPVAQPESRAAATRDVTVAERAKARRF